MEACGAGGGPIVVRGFEWTPYQGDHANVFGTTDYYPCPEDWRNPWVVWEALSTWLCNQAIPDADHGGYIVAQFNHVRWATHLGGTLGFYGNDFGNHAFIPALEDIFCLAEVGYYQDWEGIGSYFFEEEEWRRYLISGWHVAPSIGLDNSGDIDRLTNSNPDRHTGVWADFDDPAATNERIAVMKALKARRVYASEDKNVVLSLKVKRADMATYQWMGTTLEVPNGVAVDMNMWVAGTYNDAKMFKSLFLVDSNGIIFRRLIDDSHGTKTNAAFSPQVSYSDLANLPKTDRGEICLYLKAIQNDGGRTFSAPIWFRLIAAPPPPTGTNNAAYVADVTVPDDTQFSPYQSFTKIWRIRNTGTSTWGSGYQWAFDGGDRMGGPDAIDVPAVSPGATWDPSVGLQAPGGAGTFTGYWRMRAPGGTKFGERTYLRIKVADPDADIGRGSSERQHFLDCFYRNGGRASVGSPVNNTHWWGTNPPVVIQDFRGGGGGDGAIIDNEGTSHTTAFWIHGAIWAKYAAMGGPDSLLHSPLSDELEAGRSPWGTTGRWNQFEGGTIHHSGHGTFITYGDIQNRYSAAGGSSGAYGFPMNDPYGWAGGTRQDFEGGFISVGTTPPSISISPAYQDNWFTSGQTVVWNATDPGTGLSVVRTWWNGEGQSDVSSSGTTPMREGNNTFHVWVRDGAGVEVAQERRFLLDTVPPSISGIAGPATGTWLGQAYTITWAASDASSGIASNGLTWDTGATQSVTPEGKHSGTITARDHAGHVTNTSVGPYWIDLTAPVVDVTLAPAQPDGDNGWYRTAPIWSMVAGDGAGSGVTARLHIFDGVETPYTGQLALPQGTHTIAAKAIDAVLHTTSTAPISVRTDTQPPVVSRVDTDAVSYSLSTLVAVWSASDAVSGISEFQYRIGMSPGASDVKGDTSVGMTSHAFITGLQLTSGGVYYISIRSKDVAGNWSGWIPSYGITVLPGGGEDSPNLNTGGVSTPLEARRSENYVVVDSVGQLAVDISYSGNYVVQSGYWHPDVGTSFVGIYETPNFNGGGVSGDVVRTSQNYRVVDSLGEYLVETSASDNYIVESGLWHSEASVHLPSVLYSWGNNGGGQLGNNTTTNGLIPGPVQNLTGVVSVYAGRAHGFAITGDRRVYVWGFNNNGQLGIGNQTSQKIPVELTSLPNVRFVDGGENHSVACTTDGKVYTWGGNSYGQLGLGNTTQYTTPQLVPGVSGVIQVSTGYGHTLALTQNGTVYAWGFNNLGQLGNGTQADSLVPVVVAGLTGIVSVSAGNNHSLALKSDGTVWSWGSNASGQLGMGSGSLSTTPVQVNGLTGTVKQVSAGRNFSLAVTNDGKAWGWGVNDYGQLGLGDTTKRTLPVIVSSVSPVRLVSAGGFHSAFVREDGTVWSSGYNTSGQMGDGTTQVRSLPVKASAIGGVTSVSAGESFTLALRSTTPPYEAIDIAGCLRIVGGLDNATSYEVVRYNVVTDNPAITIADAALIARKVAGLEANP